MINNYFFLTRFVRELQSDLTGSTFQAAFSQEKNKLLLSFLVDGSEMFLEFHTGAQLPYLQVRESFRRAKKNTSTFFESVYSSRLKNIQVARFERILKFEFDKFCLYLLFRGKDSNAFIISKAESVEVFKSVDEDTLRKIYSELKETEFDNTFLFTNEITVNTSIKEFKNHYPFFGKKIIAEILLRTKDENKSFNQAVVEVLAEINENSYGLFFSESLKEYSIFPESFLLTHNLRTDAIFNSCNDAVRGFLLVQMQFHLFQSLYKQASKYFEKLINYLTAKLEAINKKVDEGSKESVFTERANLLLINLQYISKGMKSVEIGNIYHDGKAEIILLKENLSPNENVNHYFSKAKSEKIFFARAEKEISQLSKRLKIALEQQKQLCTITSLYELKLFMKTLPLKSDGQNSKTPKINFKQFLIDGTWRVFVGKDSKNNDLLTTKFAKQNDFWFHARSVSGSHVVLRVENTKEVVPKPVLKKAAQLAAFYSKAKTAGTAPVSYALKKFVVKRKGMEVGMVSMLREDTLLVKPEIPQGCEMIIDDI